MAKLLAYLFSVCCLVYVLPVNAKPCFITNCPPGGKRSGSTALMPSTAVVIASRNEQCATCGPDDSGVCLGQHLCCGPSFGCYFKTKETARCLLNTSELCRATSWDGQLNFAACSLQSGNFDGLCVADRLCCSPNQCKPDMNCQIVGEVQRRRDRTLPLEFGAHLNR